MAISDLFGLIDNTLAEVFHRKPHDPAIARKPLLRGIEAAKRQFENGQTKVPNRWWKVSNKVVALTVKVGGEAFEINGHATNHIPEERFVEFLDKMAVAVNAGDFDKEIENHGKGDAKVAVGPAKRKSGISPEAAKARGEAAARTRAANKAAKAAAGA